MAARIFLVTGADTGVGKTVFASRLTRALRKQGARVAALKPVCSGGRADARLLHRAAGGVLALDEVNPWHYRAALSPLAAARKERKKLRLSQVLRHVRKIARRFDVVVLEGAGGLLSPLGEDFDSRDLITALRATPMVVSPNRLGAVGQVRLVLEALPPAFRRRARVVLANPKRADGATRGNAELLGEFVPRERLMVMRWADSLALNR
jgi:dethiobiotin synthetase